MLRPTFTTRPINLLLIGRPGSGKRTLAQQLMRSPDMFFKVHVLEQSDSKWDNVSLVSMDYVFILVDMTNTTTSALLEQALARLTPEFLLTKTSIILTKVDQVTRWMVQEEDVHNMAVDYGCSSFFYMDLQNDALQKRQNEQLIRTIAIATHQLRNVHPLTAKIMENTPDPTWITDDAFQSPPAPDA
ncbi:hypothetical protein BC940DRAFT_302143 [Gongronella butleri]|nr:hypothetical protein BC940DRAFT_302143 [Gongronella butleri]